MDEKQAREIMAKAEELAMSGDMEGARNMMKGLMQEQRAAGASIPVSQMEAMAQYVQTSVETALDEILAVADTMNATHVPVSFIREVRGLPATGVTKLWETLEVLDVPVNYGEIPDDLSELEDLG